jgi:hypothetical protein
MAPIRRTGTTPAIKPSAHEVFSMSRIPSPDARQLSPLLLDQAALDAVRQWVYSITLVDGVPVPVIMTVTVSFRLG